MVATSAKKLRFAVICSSNMNRSMEAHHVLNGKGFNVQSYGTGNNVKLPGPSIDKPNVYEFETTPYDFIYRDLKNKDPKLYQNNGLLHILDRNRRIKRFPQKFQKCSEYFDVIISLEERVYDQVLDFLQNRPPETGEIVHVINVDIVDNPQDATVGAIVVANLCQKLEEAADSVEGLDAMMDDVLTDFEARNPTRNIMNTVCFY
uniref:RNA polymerase II subunit A C-terminal domain phosphatase SSU72 n=1 Tax=Panagrolaimus sp. JU765 TaxID=591449 RepID=A0AC34QET0_9BILA